MPGSIVLCCRTRSHRRFRRYRKSAVVPAIVGIVFYCLSSWAATANAQDGIGHLLAPPTLSTSTASTGGSPFDAIDGTRTDVLFGRNTKGPYLLGWKQITANSETVVRDGLILQRDKDYTIVPASGALSFPAPLGPDKVVRVTYRCDGPGSTPNTASPLNIPMQWDLWTSNSNHLRLQTLYTPQAAGLQGSPLNTTMQFVAGTKLARSSDLSMGFYGDLHGGDWLGHTGLQLADHTKFRYADITASFARAGAQFTQSGANGLTTGQQVAQLSGIFQPIHALNINLAVKDTASVPDGSAAAGTSHPGTETREFAQSLSYAFPKKVGTVQAGRTITDSTAADGSSTVRTADSLAIHTQIAKGTDATVGYTAAAQQNTGATGSAPVPVSYSQNTSVQFKSQPNKQLTVTGDFLSSAGSTAGDTEGIHIEAIPIAAIKALRLVASWQDAFQQTGARRSREATLELPPLPIGQTKLAAGVKETSGAGQERLTAVLSGSTKPARYVQITGSAQYRDGSVNGADPDPNAVDGYNVQLGISPWKQLKISGGVAANPSAPDGTAHRLHSRSLGVESTFGIFSLHGSYGLEDQYLAARLNNTLGLGIDVRLTKWDTLTSGYEDHSQADNDTASTTVFRLGFTHNLGPAFDLSLTGSMTRSALYGASEADKQEIKGEAKLGLHF